MLTSTPCRLIYRELLLKVSPQFLGCMKQAERKVCFDNIFLCGCLTESWLCLSDFVSSVRTTVVQLETTLGLIQQFCSESLAEMIILFTDVSGCGDSDYAVDAMSATVCKSLVSLPEHVAASCQSKNLRYSFDSHGFLRRIAVATVRTLEHVQKRLADNRDASLKMLSTLLGKLHMVGRSKDVLGILVPWLAKRAANDSQWRRVSQHFLTKNIPRSALEGLLTEVLLIASAGDIDGLLGDAVCEETSIQFLITKKLFLVRYSKENVWNECL